MSLQVIHEEFGSQGMGAVIGRAELIET